MGASSYSDIKDSLGSMYLEDSRPWRERRVKELALMDDLAPLLKKRAAGRDISGLSAYEQ